MVEIQDYPVLTSTSILLQILHSDWLYWLYLTLLVMLDFRQPLILLITRFCLKLLTLLVMLDFRQPLILLITRFCLKGCSTTLAFPEYPCNGLSHTWPIEVKGLQFRECCLGFLISIVTFPKVPALVRCSTSSMHQSCSTSLSDIFPTRTATLTILSYI